MQVALQGDGALDARLERILGRALAETPFLAGDALSLADVSLMPYVAALPIVGAQGIVADTPHVARWWERVSARPSWTAATAACKPG